ncbi:MAG: repeat protein [Clostridia bacterium]|jgi:hypothetical protein|nr:repeat protein [Clostridia bacterium]
MILVLLLIFAGVFAYLQRGLNSELQDKGEQDTDPIESGEELYVIRDNGRYGYINKSGLVVIKPQFEDAYNFSEGLARISVQHKYGFIDKDGKIVIEPVFDDAGDFIEGMVRVSIDNKYGFIDKAGKAAIPLEYEVVSEFSEGLAGIYAQGKWGFINNKGKVVIQPRFNNVGFFKNGLAPVSENELYGYINKKGQYVIEPKYNYANNFSEHLAMVGIDNKYGYIDIKGNEVIQLKYQSGFDFSEGLAAVMEAGKWGFIDKKGSFLIKPAYETADSFSEGRAAVYDGKYWGYADGFGNIVINPQFSYVERFSKGLAAVRVDEASSYVDLNGRLVWREVEDIDIQGTDGVLGRLIKMRIQSDEYDLIIEYPYVLDMSNHELQNKINQLIKDQSGTDYKGRPNETFRQDYDVMLNKNGILSILNQSDMYMEGAAHGLSMRSAINIDMLDGKLYALSDLFKANADYKSKLNTIIKKKLADDNIPLLREFEGIGDKQEYYLTDKELVVYYQLYDYTPYAYGFLEFYIPYEDIANIIEKKGPIGRMLEVK